MPHTITPAAFRSRAISSASAALWQVRVLKVPTLSPLRSFRRDPVPWVSRLLLSNCSRELLSWCRGCVADGHMVLLSGVCVPTMQPAHCGLQSRRCVCLKENVYPGATPG